MSEAPNLNEFICSTQSLAAGEDLYATASQVQVWLLLEYTEAWGRKAFEESQLAPVVKTHLGAAIQTIPQAKLVLIRRQSADQENGLHFFLVKACEQQPQTFEFHLDRYADLLELDFTALMSGAPTSLAHRRTQPLFLTCTNGRRDACCARFGTEVYTAMQALVPAEAWQTTHVGGHRFAANLVYLPFGLYYGRLRAQDARRVVASSARGEILLEHYRGRACFPPAVQAADYFLRRETGNLDLQAYRWSDFAPIGQDQWSVQFTATQSRLVYRLKIRLEQSDQEIYHDCRQDKSGPVSHYHLQAIQEVSK